LLLPGATRDDGARGPTGARALFAAVRAVVRDEDFR
jgi:hypothetical protein